MVPFPSRHHGIFFYQLQFGKDKCKEKAGLKWPISKKRLKPQKLKTVATNKFAKQTCQLENKPTFKEELATDR